MGLLGGVLHKWVLLDTTVADPAPPACSFHLHLCLGPLIGQNPQIPQVPVMEMQRPPGKGGVQQGCISL